MVYTCSNSHTAIYYPYHEPNKFDERLHGDMMEEQHTTTPTDTTSDFTYRRTSHRNAPLRILRNILLGIVFALILLCIEGGIWLLNPFHLFGAGMPSSLSALLALPLHAPLFLLVPLLEIIAVCLLVQLSDKPRALLAYQRDLRNALERYCKVHTPLHSLPDMYETAVAYYQDDSDSTISNPGRNISILEVAQQLDQLQLILGEPGSGKTILLHLYQYIALQDRWALLRGRMKIPIYISIKNYNLFLKEGVRSPAPSVRRGEGGGEGLGGPLWSPATLLSTATQQNTSAQLSLLDYLYASNLPGIHRLQPFLQKLISQGRVIFLFDDLNELSRNDLAALTTELAPLMLQTQNRFVMTCIEGDYQELPELEELVNELQVARAVISPLGFEQIRSFVERYIEESDKQWRHTAGQIMELINRTRFNYICTNPMMFFTLMEIIDEIGIARGKQIDTRGRLLKEFVARLMQPEQKQPDDAKEIPSEKDVLFLFGEIATAACSANQPDAISLNVNMVDGNRDEHLHAPHLEHLAEKLQTWLNEHPPIAPFMVNEAGKETLHKSYNSKELARLLEFAHRSALIDINSKGILTFRHELIAEYFIAEYFLASIEAQEIALNPQDTSNQEPMPGQTDSRGRFIAPTADLSAPSRQLPTSMPNLHILRWCGPVAMWAGLSSDPMELAQTFAALQNREPDENNVGARFIAPAPSVEAQFMAPAQSGHAIHPTYNLQALLFSLICVGVSWKPPHVGTVEDVVERSGPSDRPREASNTNILQLPPGLEEALANVVQDAEARAQLAHLITLCAEEGIREIYQALPLLAMTGMDDVLILLDEIIVPELLFKVLCDTIDDAAYETLDKRLIRALGRFGEIVVNRAAQLSQPAPQRSGRLQSAAINILGATNDEHAVEPLLACLSDTNSFIIDRAVAALVRLGPEITLSQENFPHLIAELQNPAPSTVMAALRVLERFLDNQSAPVGTPFMASASQRQRIQEAILPLVLTQSTVSTGTLAGRGEGGGEGLGGPLWSPAAPIDIASKAREILVRQARTVGEDDTTTAQLLVQNLSSTEDAMIRSVMQMLQEIGPPATPTLLKGMNAQTSELVRMHILEVLGQVRDPRALPHLLQLLRSQNELGPHIQQQLTATLRAFAPESIPGLIDTVLHSDSEQVATRAEQILGEIGEEAVNPIIHALFPIVPGRTHLLVHVLEQMHATQSIPALLALLEAAGQPQGPSLQVPPTTVVGTALAAVQLAIIHALGQFSDKQVVPPLLSILASPEVLIYEGAINALSQLAEVALDGLLVALDVEEKTIITSRVQRALLGMRDFPGEQLLAAVAQGSDAQAQHILEVFALKGAEAAQVLAAHLVDKNTRIRSYVYQTLSQMHGQEIVPALLEELNRPDTIRQEVITELLLEHPQEAIPPLVDVLSEHERGEAAIPILLAFGPEILPSLISGLDNLNNMAQERTQQLIVEVVHQHPEALPGIVQLFNLPPPPRAREALLDVLTNDLADISIPPLLAGLEDAHLIGDVSEALLRFVSRHDAYSEMVLKELLGSLRKGNRRYGAEIALVNIGEQAVPEVGKLITDSDQSVAQAAQDILCRIGVPAFPFIWAARSDTSNLARRDAARTIFRNMPTVVIKDELVHLLSSDEPDSITMALTLLLERIHDEAAQAHSDQEMIPALLEYVQMHAGEHSRDPIYGVPSQRIIGLLLLLGWKTVIHHMAQVLYDFPNHAEQLLHAFLLLGEDAQEVLLQMLHDPNTPAKLQAEVASILGMLAEYEDVSEYARTISEYGLWAGRTTISQPGILQPDRLALSLRALGGLLAGGHWNIPRLQELQDESREGSATRELYDILLGWRYNPRIVMLENDLRTERTEHETDVHSLQQQLLMQQMHIHELEHTLEEAHQEHTLRVDELNQLTDELNRDLKEITRDRQLLRDNLQQAAKQNSILSNNLRQAIAERDRLEAKNEQWQAYCEQLERDIQRLRGA